MEDPDFELVQQGKQCMACRFDINDDEDYGEPRVCQECQEDTNNQGDKQDA